MADSMEVDMDGPRGVKRTAAEAGLPPETPRRIKVRYYVCKDLEYP